MSSTSKCVLTLVLTCLLVSGQSVTAGKYNPVLKIGQEAPDWKGLKGVDGRAYARADFKDREVLVLVFTCNTCPFSVVYEDRLIAFTKEFCGKDSKVGLVAICSNRVEEDNLEHMKERAQKKGFHFPYVKDQSQQVAKDYGATYTPEFVVLDSQRKVVYLGAMDDHSQPQKVSKRYLTDAVQAVLVGKKPKVAETPAVGCAIRYIRTRRQR